MKNLEFKEHNSGEWRLEASDSNSITVMSGNKDIALIENNDTFLLTEKDWLNAKLIASAPNLMKSLKKCIKVLKEHNKEHQKSWDNVIKEAEEVINNCQI